MPADTPVPKPTPNGADEADDETCTGCWGTGWNANMEEICDCQPKPPVPMPTPIERRPRDPEAAHALRLANKVLDQPDRDPDDDLSVLARRMLRERETAGAWLKATADARADRDRLTAALHSILTTARKSAQPECITIAREAWAALGLPPEASP